MLLLVAVSALLAVVLVFAASTSATAFGTYNPAWDGAADLQDAAQAAGAEPTVVREVSAYDEVEPGGTVAVVLAPREPYSAAEVASISRFVAEGGTLLVADDFGSRTNRLLTSLGAESRINGSLVRDERHQYRSPAMPVATNVTPHPYTADVEQLTANHASFVEPNGSTVLVRTSGYAYPDRNRSGDLDDGETLGAYPLVTVEPIGNGTLVVASDPSLFINVMLERPGNAAFVRNLFGAHESVVLDYSHAGGLPPLSVAVLILRDSVGLQLLVGLGAVCAVVLWTRGRWPTIGQGERSTGEAASAWSEPALVAYLERRHPDWDDSRLRRVVRGIMGREGESGGDE